MKLGNQYIIPFVGLKEGEHRFTFSFEKGFFDEHEVLEARSGQLQAEVLLVKRSNMLDLEINIKGYLEIQCDRCLEYFNFPIRYRGDLVVKFGEDSSAGTDEIWILPPGAYELDLEQYFFESTGLCLPIQRVHPEDEHGNTSCNTEMLNMLGTHKSESEETEDLMDPRWNKLKNLLNDTNTN